ncbi:MAG: DUF3160 domain-containing protein [Patescibacteria group bacterium]|jgi:hypothetical protein|nr:DUF3160 domain-containing protein [Patescibacteria group bacterium]
MINQKDFNSLEPQASGKKSLNKFIWLGLALVIVSILALGFLAAYFFFGSQPGNPPQTTAEEQGLLDSWKFVLVQPVFAQNEEEFNNVVPAIPLAKPEFGELTNLESFKQDSGIEFSAAQQSALSSDGFFLASNNIIGKEPSLNDFVDSYNYFSGSRNEYFRQADDAVFITSDLGLHLYHILIDRSFQSIEEKKFQPMLRAMTKALFLDSLEKYNLVTNLELKDSYKRLSAYYLVPLVVLDAGNKASGVELEPSDFETYAQYLQAMDEQTVKNSAAELVFGLVDKTYDGQILPDEIYDLARQELLLIASAEEIADSPLFTPWRPEFQNDYTQFKPRSHYTKNDILKSYFIAMMWYGRMGFPLTSPELTRDALLITAQVNNLKVSDQDLSKLWSDFAAVINFFVGEVDDLTPYQYTDVIKKVYGSTTSPADFADSQKLNDFIAQAKADLPAPKIISEALWVFDDGGQRDELLNDLKQFRFMGQRFTPDAYIINNLTQGAGAPEPETGQMLPSMPTALMPIHILQPQNRLVEKYLDDWVNDPERIVQQDRQSDKIIAKVLNRLQAEFATYDNNTWLKNIYWRWLNLFRPLLGVYGEGYPYFMQTQAWQQKNLGTVLGSFTELKHDTLLYAKQSYAELGAGMPEDLELPPVVKGYVEPDLVFWNRLISLAQTTKTGLDLRDAMPEDYKDKYDTFIDAIEFLRDIAKQELLDQKISDEDFEKLRTISFVLRQVAEPLPGQELTTREKRAGIIADIHTDALKGQILYEATGKPYIIYVAVKDINGTRLTRGVVFNHYEFADKLGERLADEDWQAKVYEGASSLPPADIWSAELIK